MRRRRPRTARRSRVRAPDGRQIPSSAPAYEPLPPRSMTLRAPPSSSPGARAGSARRSRSARRARRGAGRDRLPPQRPRGRGDRRGARALGAEPVLVRGNVSSARVPSEVAALGPLDVLVHNAATGVIRPALETEDKHWDWTLNANARALLSLARAAAPAMPRGSVDRRDLEPRLDPRARELHPRRHVEGRARGARPLPRRRARPARHPRQRRLGRASSRRARSSTSRTARRCSRPARSEPRRPAGRRRRTSPAPWRSSARPTPR